VVRMRKGPVLAVLAGRLPRQGLHRVSFARHQPDAAVLIGGASGAKAFAALGRV
jgi:hypothetical protein